MNTNESDEIAPFTEGEYKGMTRAEVALQHLMSDVSEECYCAGWMADCEFDIWRLATEGGTWGVSGAEWLPQLAVILSHAREIDRWIVWNPDDNGGDDPWYIAVPLAEWEQRYAAEMAKREAAHQARLAKQAACDHADRRLDFMKRDYCPTCFLYFTEGNPAESSVDPEAEQSGRSEEASDGR